MKAKLEMLKDLLHQMQVLMADGHGDDKEAGEDAMDSIGDTVDKPVVAEDDDEEVEDEGEPDIKSAVRAAFKPQKAPPSKGAMVVMGVGKKADKAEAFKKKGKGLKYG